MPDITFALVFLLISLIITGVVLFYVLGLRSKISEVQASLTNALSNSDEKVGRILREEIARNREEQSHAGRELREEIGGSIAVFQKIVSDNLHKIQEGNKLSLDEIRVTVGEKLHATLETRLSESFKRVDERLETVHRGLGEMQTLAQGVGDLKKVMSNVKTRGIWGEVQLAALLEELLIPQQYERNVIVRPGSSEVVEFAIKLPGTKGDSPVWLAIDSKFPLDSYQQLIDATEKGDFPEMEQCSKALEQRVKSFAKDIRDKYIVPPFTTDFAILFLPTEGLYAEIVRRASLVDQLQRDYRVVVAGPGTFGAFLNSLQMGFRTLAIQERSSEVWKVLGAVKAEFGKFGDLLEQVQKKLDSASKNIEDVSKKTKTITRTLRDIEVRDVEALPSPEIRKYIELETDLKTD
jgi:DNA recombination protein RmuC